MRKKKSENKGCRSVRCVFDLVSNQYLHIKGISRVSSKTRYIYKYIRFYSNTKKVRQPNDSYDESTRIDFVFWNFGCEIVSPFHWPHKLEGKKNQQSLEFERRYRILMRKIVLSATTNQRRQYPSNKYSNLVVTHDVVTSTIVTSTSNIHTKNRT